MPRAWVPLFEARARARIAPIQFALGGMNAHINRDLPFALVETWAALDVEPDRAKAEFAQGVLGHVDRSLGDVDDAVAMWKVSRARDSAWANAEALWALRGVPAVSAQYAAALDRLVGFAGRGLLKPLR